MPKGIIDRGKQGYEKLAEIAWRLDKFRWIMYEIKLDTEKGKILGAIIYLSGSEALLPEKPNDFKENLLVEQLTKLGYNRKLVLESIEELTQRTPQNN